MNLCIIYHLTFKVEGLIPARVECSPLYLGLESVLLVGQQRHPHVRVRQPVRVLRREVLRLWDMGIVIKLCIGYMWLKASPAVELTCLGTAGTLNSTEIG